MNKKSTKQTFRIFLLIGTIVSMFFVPWILVKAWIVLRTMDFGKGMDITIA